MDAKDNQGDWRVGYIIEKNVTSHWYKIRFDGWASKYDEVSIFINFSFLSSTVLNSKNFVQSLLDIQDKNKTQPYDQVGNLQLKHINRKLHSYTP